MKRTIDPNYCKKTFSSGGRGFSSQCTRKPIKDGYCRQHHPDAVHARDKAREETYKAARLYSNWKHHKDELRADIASAAIARQPTEDLVRKYEEHLKNEPPKPA